jgi:hypothetical protein
VLDLGTNISFENGQSGNAVLAILDQITCGIKKNELLMLLSKMIIAHVEKNY